MDRGGGGGGCGFTLGSRRHLGKSVGALYEQVWEQKRSGGEEEEQEEEEEWRRRSIRRGGGGQGIGAGYRRRGSISC